MSLQTAARTAFAAIKTAHPELVVAVASDDETCEGIRGVDVGVGNPTLLGEDGLESNTVRVDASEFAEQDFGATITVDGETVFVSGQRLDPAGALRQIAFQKTRPIDDSIEDDF